MPFLQLISFCFVFVCVMMIIGSCVCVFVVGKFEDVVILLLLICVFSMNAFYYNYIGLVMRRANSVLQGFFFGEPLGIF